MSDLHSPQTRLGTRATAIDDSIAPDQGMADLAGLFLRDLPDRLDALQASWQQGEQDEIRSQAHLLAGAAMMCRLEPISRAARLLEITMSQGHIVDSDGVVTRRYHDLIETCRGMLAAA